MNQILDTFTFSSPLLATKPHTTILSAPRDVYRTVTGLFSYLFCSTVPPVCTHRTAETTEKTIQQLWVAAAVETKRAGPKVKLFSTLRCTIEAITNDSEEHSSHGCYKVT